MALIVTVEFWKGPKAMHPARKFDINHDDPQQRRVLGEQARAAFEAGQKVVTYPKYARRSP